MTAKVALEKKFPSRVIDVPGAISRTVRVVNTHGSISVGRSERAGMFKFKSAGLVVAFNGGGDEPKDTPAYIDASEISRAIVRAGGIVLNGGRNTGIMQATGEVAGKMCLGVNFPEQIKKAKAHNFGTRLVVHPLTRLALLTWCPPIVIVYSGTLGTFHELINALVGIKNQSLYGITAPQLFISQYWKNALSEHVKSKVIPKSYLNDVVFFSDRRTVLKQLFN